MSLKGFHILLISLSSLLVLLFGGWSLRAYVETDATGQLIMALFCFVLAAALLVYIVWFARKIRTREDEERQRRKMIRTLAVSTGLWLLGSRGADACSVCYGEAEGPMIDAARLGVYLLFGLVLAVQMAFVLFFLYLRRHAREAGSL